MIEQELVQAELEKYQNQVEELFPAVKERSEILNGVDTKNLKEGDDFSLGGIDIQKYSDLEDDTNVAKSVIYSDLRLSSLELLGEFGENQLLLNNESLKQLNYQLSEANESKKRKIDDLNAYRQSLQEGSKDMIDYLNNRWKEGIKTNVELGIESLKMELEM